ncbi:beta-1,3-glucan-binding protein-like isoform X1 [Maniola jurtina]|uniref:beta-1,3-glucan-binding protein-like isoform X1 n=1 Tax=Maniola jurtina TaxID=191418 RepID=UPI001E68B63D|nr:beta-1,3-glucan-binding protein-like isoform X1 [Maniola jurtina]
MVTKVILHSLLPLIGEPLNMCSSIWIGVILLICAVPKSVQSVGTEYLHMVEPCLPSVTTVGGTHAPDTICSGALIFADEFDEFNLETWQHENTLAGGGNWEFQYYNNNRTNSFTDDGILFIRPSLTSDQFGESFLSSGRLYIDGGAPADRCTDPQWFGCERTGTPTNILNPIKSARIRTANSFSFRYGRVEARAKLPAGDWLWPAIWLMPAFNAYGTWPSSGEIDIMESRGNRDLLQDGVNIGVQEAASTLHYGPYSQLNGWERAHWVGKNDTGYNSAFHLYQLEWTPDYIKFSIDNVELGKVDPGKGGFWKYGDFDSNRNIENPWRYGSKMAPFDQKFYIIINLAVGGTSGYFPDGVQNPTPKPWLNSSPKAATDFWDAREAWLPTWGLDQNDGRNASLQVDYVRVWAL